MLDFLKRLFSGKKAPAGPAEPTDSGSRAIFWFNWKEMSDGASELRQVGLSATAAALLTESGELGSGLLFLRGWRLSCPRF